LQDFGPRSWWLPRPYAKLLTCDALTGP